MGKGVKNTIIICMAFMALMVGLSVNRILSPTTMTHEQLLDKGLYVYDVPRRFSDFLLTKHTGETFTHADLEGKWTLIFFGYTYCPDVCPTTMASLGQLSKMLEETDYSEDTQIIMVSVDPERDTLDKLESYVNFFNADYIGATGEYINIFTLARQLNIAFSYLPSDIEGEYDVTHSGEIPLINPNGHFQGFFKYPAIPEQMLETYSSVRLEYSKQ